MSCKTACLAGPSVPHVEQNPAGPSGHGGEQLHQFAVIPVPLEIVVRSLFTWLPVSGLPKKFNSRIKREHHRPAADTGGT